MEDIYRDWTGKRAYVQILKNGVPLTFTARDIIINGSILSFTDKAGIRYGFPMHTILEVKEIL